MKINAITIYNSIGNIIKNNSTGIKLNKNIKDTFSFAGNFNNSMSKTFKERVKDTTERENIVTTIISDSKGNYRPEIEKLFLNKLDFSAKCLKRDGVELDDSTYPYLVKAARVAFRAVKDRDEFVIGKNKNPIDVLTRIGYIALLNGVENLEDTFEFAKKDGKIIDIMTLQSVLQWESCFTYDFSPENSLKALNKYCNYNNEPEYNLIIPVATLFSNADCINFEECDRVYKMILDKDGNFDLEKRNFVFKAISLIKYLFNDGTNFPYYNENGHINDKIKNQGMYSIVENFLNKARLSDDKFDGEKAYKSFEDWVTYAVSSKDIINKNTILDVEYYPDTAYMEKKQKTVEEYYNPNDGSTYFFITPFYRVYSVIVDENNYKVTA